MSLQDEVLSLHASQYNLIPYNSKEIRGRINNLTYDTNSSSFIPNIIVLLSIRSTEPNRID